MSYTVIHSFADLTDNKHTYLVGDEYPRQGSFPSEKRIKELSGYDNKMRRPFIKKNKEDFSKYMNEPKSEEAKTYTKEEIMIMPIAELRKLAKENGIKVNKGEEIKKLLCAKFGL